MSAMNESLMHFKTWKGMSTLLLIHINKGKKNVKKVSPPTYFGSSFKRIHNLLVVGSE